jgi:rhamnosyltransferase
MKLLTIIIVLYNLGIDVSSSFSLANVFPSITFFFVDNSTDVSVKKRNSLLWQDKQNVRYLQNEKNIGLSKAYNNAISLLDSKYIMILDQDTKITFDYINALLKKLQSIDSSFFIAPYLVSSKKPFSPSIYRGVVRKSFFRGKISNQKEVALPVNSCSCFSKIMFNKIGGFDEKLFLDYVDIDFFYRATLAGFRLFVLDKTINQEFSGYSKNISYETVSSRFLIFVHDSYFFKQTHPSKWYINLLVAKRSLHLFLKFKKWFFIKESIKFFFGKIK